MTTTRRGFLGSLAALAVAPFVRLQAKSLPHTTGTYGSRPMVATYEIDRYWEQLRREARVDMQFACGDQWPESVRRARLNHQPESNGPRR